MGDTNWKIRKEGLDHFEVILEEAHQKISMTNINDILPALKARLNDSNKNLIMQTVELIGKLASAIGKPFERSTKQVLSQVAGCLNDNKTHVRNATIRSLDSILKATQLNSMLPILGSSLLIPAPSLRKELLKWLNDKMEPWSKSPKYHDRNLPSELTSMVDGLLSCLQDKDSEVRKSAQSCIIFLIPVVGYTFLCEKAGDLRSKAAVQAVMPVLECE